MKQPLSPTKPQFIEEQNGVTDSLPTFVTRTTLQAILQAYGVKTLPELETCSVALSYLKQVPPGTPATE
jgi:hypothetical protein